MDIVSITLNGREVSGNSGMSIFDLAKESGISIPTLCHDPNLPAYGACRICVVEDERNGALVASCVTPISTGMVINTQSAKVKERRTTLLKLMLASHPDTCMVCDKGNCCELRKIASDMGVGFIDFQRIPQKTIIREVNPFIQRDLSKCILCGKCIRADQELVVEGAIDYLHRGFISKPATLADQPLEKSECTFCGTCVAICPTGALSEKDKRYWGTTNSTVNTVCPYCGCGCGVTLHTKDNAIVRSLPDIDSPINHGTLCVRGSYGYDFVHSQDRLTSPLIKQDGELKTTTWANAIDVIVKEFNNIKNKYSSDSLAILGSSKCTNEENYLLQKLGRCALGTNNIDNGSRLYNVSNQIFSPLFSHGSINSGTIDDIERSDVLLVIGANPTISNPLVGYAIKRAIKYRDAKLILIDPLQIELSKFAHIWFRSNVGTDTSLLMGILKIILGDRQFSQEGNHQKIKGLDGLLKVIQNSSMSHVEQTSGISKQDMQDATKLIMSADRVSIVYGNGITQHFNAAAAIAAIECLSILKNKGLVKIYFLQRENNSLGARNMGSLPDYLPGYQSFINYSERNRFEDYWKCKLPTDKGFNALEMITQAQKGVIKGIYIVGENPVQSFPQPDLVTQSLESLDFLVVQDMFLTETAKLAKVVLPASSFAEKEGTYTNFEGRAQQLNRALIPLENSKPDWEIITFLSTALGYPMSYSSPSQIMLEIKELVPACNRSCFEGNDNEETSVTWKEKGGESSKISVDSSIIKNYKKQSNSPDYPFTLITGSSRYHFGIGTRSMRSKRLRKYAPENIIEINQKDADKKGISNGSQVSISSSAGKITATAKISELVSPETVYIPLTCNRVMALFELKNSNLISLKSCCVNLERINYD